MLFIQSSYLSEIKAIEDERTIINDESKDYATIEDKVDTCMSTQNFGRTKRGKKKQDG